MPWINKPKLELIEWVDACGCSRHWGRATESEVEPITCQSIGWVIHENAKCVVIAPHVHDETEISGEQYCGDMTIPKVAIMRRILIEVPSHD